MFKFKLEPVLSLKEKIEDSKKRELGLAVSEEQQLCEQKRCMVEQREAALQQARSNQGITLDIQSLKLFNQYSMRLEKEIKAKDAEIIKAGQKVADKRNELLEALKDRKILENLKEIQREAYLEEEKKEEQREMDDIVTYKYGIKGKE